MNILFELSPLGPFDWLPVFMILYTCILSIAIIHMIVVRIVSFPSEIRKYMLPMSSTIFYFALAGYFLVIMRLAHIPYLSMLFLHVLWAIAFLYMLWRMLTGFKKAQRKAYRIRVREEEKKSHEKPVDPYVLEAQRKRR